MKKISLSYAYVVLALLLPFQAHAEAYLHYTKLWHVTEREWPTLNNPMVLRTYVRNGAGYVVPSGYRVVHPRNNECVVPVPEDLIALVADIWENAEPDNGYSGRNVYVKLKDSGVTEYTITRQREIVNKYQQVRQLLPADYEFLTDHFMSIAEITSCS